MQTKIEPPKVDIPRYAAPRIAIAHVNDVLPSEPIPGSHKRSKSQYVLLAPRGGWLRFHESDEHRTLWDPAWTCVNDVPRDIWKHWHPGTPFRTGDGYALFEPVPEVLCFPVNPGYRAASLDAAAANAVLSEIVPYAQELVDNLYNVAGTLDWSAASFRAGRNLMRLLSPQRQAAPREADKDLVEFGDIVARFPHVYRPDLVTLEAEDLAEECDSQTRYLASPDLWGSEIKEVFGRPFKYGTPSPASDIDLKVCGVRAWYHAAILQADPRPPLAFSAWDAQQGCLEDGTLSSSMTDEELEAWAADQVAAAAREGWRLLGPLRAARRQRNRLREQDWDRLAVVGARLAGLEQLRAERQALVTKAIGWGLGDSEIGAQGRVSRQAVFQVRERLNAEAAGAS